MATLRLARNTKTGAYYGKSPVPGFHYHEGSINVTYLTEQEAALVRASYLNVETLTLTGKPWGGAVEWQPQA